MVDSFMLHLVHFFTVWRVYNITLQKLHEYQDQRPLSLKDTFKSLSPTLRGQAQILTCTECLRPQGQLVTGIRPQVQYPGLGTG